MKKLIFLATVISSLGFGVIQKGQTVPGFCFKAIGGKQACISDSPGKIRVLIYSAGWCPGCKELMMGLAPKVADYSGKPVEFTVLLVDGFTKGAGVTDSTMQQYKTQYHYTGRIAASVKNVGKEFVEPPYYIPLVVYVGKSGELLDTQVGPEPQEVLEFIDNALGPV